MHTRKIPILDRLFWILSSKYVDEWRAMLHALHHDTVVRWHRQGFRLYWPWKSRDPEPGRPAIDAGLRTLIREKQAANKWTAQQIVEAFPFDSAPRYLLRDRDAAYGEVVQRRIKSLGIAVLSLRLAHHGKILLCKELSDPYGGIVRITSLLSMNGTYAEYFANISNITMPAGRIYR